MQTQSPPEFVNNVKALVTIAQIYELPSIITTSAADGPNGPIMPVVAEGLPDATIVHSGCTSPANPNAVRDMAQKDADADKEDAHANVFTAAAALAFATGTIQAN